MLEILSVVLSYLIGSIPFGYLLVKFMTGRDVRQAGSGNIGATNVLRSTGRVAAVLTLVLDIAKGYLAVWLTAQMAGQSPFWLSASALAVMAGHSFPIFLGFKGGKAVATFIGAFLYLTLLPLLAVMLVFIVMVAITRLISVGSILAAATFPLGVWIILHPPSSILIASLISAAFIVYRHSANIVRIRAGNENVFSWSGKK